LRLGHRTFNLPRVQSAKRISFFAALIVLSQAQASLPNEWKVVQVDGRDYVSFANVAQFYQFPRFTQVNRMVSLASDHSGLRAQSGTSEFYLNSVRFFSDYPLLVHGEENLISAIDVAKIIEPVLRPNRIASTKPITTVVLDPGHGGDDSGTVTVLGNEKTYALDVALAAREELSRAGFKVEMTRSTDENVSLEQRVEFANRFPDAVFISIHFNSSPGGSGVETYVLAPAGVPSNTSTEDHPATTDSQAYPGNEHDPSNIALAAAVQGAILSRVSVFDRGVRHSRFLVLREIIVPGVLVEAGFLNDPTEGTKIASPYYRQQLGQALAQAVTAYQRATTFHSSATIVARAGNLPAHSRSIIDSLGASAPAKPAQSPSAVIETSN
jgi:N-acetylmuramoyl-L-alanine amidase